MFLAPSFHTVGFFLIYSKAAALRDPIFVQLSPIRLFTLGVFFLGTHEEKVHQCRGQRWAPGTDGHWDRWTPGTLLVPRWASLQDVHVDAVPSSSLEPHCGVIGSLKEGGNKPLDVS